MTSIPVKNEVGYRIEDMPPAVARLANKYEFDSSGDAKVTKGDQIDAAMKRVEQDVTGTPEERAARQAIAGDIKLSTIDSKLVLADPETSGKLGRVAAMGVTAAAADAIMALDEGTLAGATIAQRIVFIDALRRFKGTDEAARQKIVEVLNTVPDHMAADLTRALSEKGKLVDLVNGLSGNEKDVVQQFFHTHLWKLGNARAIVDAMGPLGINDFSGTTYLLASLKANAPEVAEEVAANLLARGNFARMLPAIFTGTPGQPLPDPVNIEGVGQISAADFRQHLDNFLTLLPDGATKTSIIKTIEQRFGINDQNREEARRAAESNAQQAQTNASSQLEQAKAQLAAAQAKLEQQQGQGSSDAAAIAALTTEVQAARDAAQQAQWAAERAEARVTQMHSWHHSGYVYDHCYLLSTPLLWGPTIAYTPWYDPFMSYRYSPFGMVYQPYSSAWTAGFVTGVIVGAALSDWAYYGYGGAYYGNRTVIVNNYYDSYGYRPSFYANHHTVNNHYFTTYPTSGHTGGYGTPPPGSNYRPGTPPPGGGYSRGGTPPPGGGYSDRARISSSDLRGAPGGLRRESYSGTAPPGGGRVSPPGGGVAPPGSRPSMPGGGAPGGRVSPPPGGGYTGSPVGGRVTPPGGGSVGGAPAGGRVPPPPGGGSTGGYTGAPAGGGRVTPPGGGSAGGAPAGGRVPPPPGGGSTGGYTGAPAGGGRVTPPGGGSAGGAPAGGRVTPPGGGSSSPPSRPSTPTPSSGGYSSPPRPPSAPSGGGYSSPPRPSTPPGGYSSPPSRPSTPSGGGYSSPPRPPSMPSGGYSSPSRPSGGYSSPPSGGGYSSPSRPSGGYSSPPSRPSGGYSSPPSRPSGGYSSPPSRPSGGYSSPSSGGSRSGGTRPPGGR